MAAVANPMDPGGPPHYFGPYPNWANNSMPTGSVASVAVTAWGTGNTAHPVTIGDAYRAGIGATATATVVGGAVTGILETAAGAGYTVPVATIDSATGTGATATASPRWSFHAPPCWPCRLAGLALAKLGTQEKAQPPVPSGV